MRSNLNNKCCYVFFLSEILWETLYSPNWFSSIFSFEKYLKGCSTSLLLIFYINITLININYDLINIEVDLKKQLLLLNAYLFKPYTSMFSVFKITIYTYKITVFIWTDFLWKDFIAKSYSNICSLENLSYFLSSLFFVLSNLNIFFLPVVKAASRSIHNLHFTNYLFFPVIFMCWKSNWI